MDNNRNLNEHFTAQQNTIYDALYELGQHRIALNLANAKTDDNGLYEDEAKIRDHIESVRYLNRTLDRAR